LTYYFKDKLNSYQHDFLQYKSTITNLVSYSAHICLSVCSKRQVYVIYCDVSKVSLLVCQTLVSPLLGTTATTRTLASSGPWPISGNERPSWSAWIPFTQSQCLLAVWRTNHLVALTVMSSQAKELTEEKTGARSTLTTPGPFAFLILSF